MRNWSPAMSGSTSKSQSPLSVTLLTNGNAFENVQTTSWPKSSTTTPPPPVVGSSPLSQLAPTYVQPTGSMSRSSSIVYVSPGMTGPKVISAVPPLVVRVKAGGRGRVPHLGQSRSNGKVRAPPPLRYGEGIVEDAGTCEGEGTGTNFDTFP